MAVTLLFLGAVAHIFLNEHGISHMRAEGEESSLTWIRRAISEARCLTVMIQPVFTYAIISTVSLLAIKYTLGNVVIDQTEGIPYADDTKAFGVFLFLTPRTVIVSLYSKKSFWFNTVIDYLMLVSPIAASGPIVWSLTKMSFVEATYKLFLAASIMPGLLSPLIFWDDKLSIAKLLHLCLMQIVVYWLVVIYNLLVSLIFLSLSQITSRGAVTAIDMVKSVCLFGVAFPILRYLSMQATRRGIKVYQFKEPTNMQEENVSKGTIFRFIVSQDIFWNTLSKLLLAEIRDNTTFSISVICSHMVTLVTRFVSAATFKRLQMERKGKTAPILSEAYNEIQRRVTIKGGSTRKASVVKSLKVSDEESLPEYDLSKNVTTKIEEPLSPVVEESDSTSVLVDVSPKEPLSSFTPISEETRFAFTNLASIFAEWCGRISAFLITLLLTSTPPQYTWTRCRDPLTVQTHIVRGSIMILLSLFMDSIGVLVEHRVAESGLKEAVEEFRKTKISWLVYLHMAMMACALSGVFVMTMPGILENGNDCFKAGRSVWV